MGAYGVTEELAALVLGDPDADLVDQGGVGGTLSGNALAGAAARATLEHVLTEESFERMTALATRYTHGVQAVLDEYGVPWVDRPASARAPSTASPRRAAHRQPVRAAHDAELDEYMHLYTLNRGIFITPFHNMALMCPETSRADVDRHTEVFGAELREPLPLGVEAEAEPVERPQPHVAAAAVQLGVLGGPARHLDQRVAQRLRRERERPRRTNPSSVSSVAGRRRGRAPPGRRSVRRPRPARCSRARTRRARPAPCPRTGRSASRCRSLRPSDG